MIKEEHLQHLAALVPHATLEKIKDCNHLTILNKPGAIELMKSYLLEQETTA